MEPQVEICCKKQKKMRCCIDLIIFILSVILSFVIGLLVGSITGVVTAISVGALVVLLITTIFCYDEFIKSSNNKGFLLQTI